MVELSCVSSDGLFIFGYVFRKDVVGLFLLLIGMFLLTPLWCNSLFSHLWVQFATCLSLLPVIRVPLVPCMSLLVQWVYLHHMYPACTSLGFGWCIFTFVLK